MKIVYIAGPFRAKNAYERRKHVREAEEMALAVAGCGAMPVCPHLNNGCFHGTLPEEFWLEGTMELLRRCDAVVMIPGWPKSSGATSEHDEAKRLGIPIFAGTNNLRAWVETGRY